MSVADGARGVWADRQREQISENNDGKEYLYSRIDSVKQTIGNPKNIMNQILRNQLNVFAERFNSLNNTQMSYTQIEEVLNDWVSGSGIIGQKIGSLMQDISDFSAAGLAQAYGTSGGTNIGDIPLSMAKQEFGQRRGELVDDISLIVNGVDEATNSLISFVNRHYDSIVAQELQACYKSGKTTVPASVGNIKDTSVSSVLQEKGAQSLASLFQTIGDNIAKLNSLSAQVSKGASSKGGINFTGKNGASEQFKQYIGSIQQAFNSIGGTLHELAYLKGAMVASDEFEKMLKDTESNIAKTLAAKGIGHFSAEWTAHNLDENGKQMKNDVSFTYTKNGIELTFGGSVKLKQNQSFRGSGEGSHLLGVQGLVARQETYDSIADKLEIYSPGIKQYGYQLLGVKEGASTGVGSDWWYIKQMAGAMTLVDAIAGTGQVGDFSALFIVNNRIFSVYDILKKILTTDNLTKGLSRPYEVHGLNYESLQKKIDNSIQQASKDKGDAHKIYREASVRNKATYRILGKAKIVITLNMGVLYGKDVFK